MSPSASMPSAFEFHEAPTQPDTHGARAPTRDSPLVLVVDDDEDTRAIYTYSLEQMGYRTWTEGNGEDGLAAARRLRPFAILMDVAMPGIDGIETTRLLRADPRTHGSLIVVVTAHGAMKFSEAREAGCDAYFCKPFNPFALDEVLRSRCRSADECTSRTRRRWSFATVRADRRWRCRSAMIERRTHLRLVWREWLGDRGEIRRAHCASVGIARAFGANIGS